MKYDVSVGKLSVKLTDIIFFILTRVKELIILLLLVLMLPTYAQETEAIHMRGSQYCEIILSRLLTNYTIYNTLGLNNCPTSLWNTVNITQIKRQTGSTLVHLNGPRYWVIDGFKNVVDHPDLKNINGITMQEAGLLHINLTELLRASRPYYKHTIKRHASWFYDAGKPVYELVDPNGDIYVMQSYSIHKAPLTKQDLTQLGAKLVLPQGWTFKTGILAQPEAIHPIHDLVTVVQDNLDGSYQKVSHDFLKKETASIRE